MPTNANYVNDDFVVTAHTTTPSIWIISEVATAQSEDNLIPAQPTGLTRMWTGLETRLDWDANTEPDLYGYLLYRGTTADFVPSHVNWIASPSGTFYDDFVPDIYFYKLIAWDENGNQSPPALLGPNGTTDVGAPVALEFALTGAIPNPASGRQLRVAFALPSAAPARLELLDVSGRRWVTREVGSLGSGRHVLDLARGRAIPAGLYWLRLAQGPRRATLRVIVLE